MKKKVARIFIFKINSSFPLQVVKLNSAGTRTVPRNCRTADRAVGSSSLLKINCTLSSFLHSFIPSFIHSFIHSFLSCPSSFLHSFLYMLQNIATIIGILTAKLKQKNKIIITERNVGESRFLRIPSPIIFFFVNVLVYLPSRLIISNRSRIWAYNIFLIIND